jgi:hypothetical protein
MINHNARYGIEFIYVSVQVLPEWERRGEGEAYQSCLRALPETDLCNGFFVALLARDPNNPHGREERKSASDETVKKRKKRKSGEADRLSTDESGHQSEGSSTKKKKKKSAEVAASAHFPETNADISTTGVTQNESGQESTVKKKKKQKNRARSEK